MNYVPRFVDMDYLKLYDDLRKELSQFLLQYAFKSANQNRRFERSHGAYFDVIFIERGKFSADNNDPIRFSFTFGFFLPEFYELIHRGKKHQSATLSSMLITDSIGESPNKVDFIIKNHHGQKLLAEEAKQTIEKRIIPTFQTQNDIVGLTEYSSQYNSPVINIALSLGLFKHGMIRRAKELYHVSYPDLNKYWRDLVDHLVSTNHVYRRLTSS